jgi:hypothetical protein
MPIAFIIVPIMLGAGVFGALTFASQETEDMSPAEQTKRLNTLVPFNPCFCLIANAGGDTIDFADLLFFAVKQLKECKKMTI